MSLRHAVRLVLISLLLPCPKLFAEETLTPAAGPLILGVGDRIRIIVPSFKRQEMVGIVVEADGKSFVLRLAERGDPVRIWFSELDRLEIARGQRSMAWQGALIGFSSGAPFLLKGLEDPSSRWLKLGSVLSGLGAGLGAAIGQRHSADKWQRTTVPATRISVAPLLRGAGLQVRLECVISEPGTHTATVTVRDGHGGVARASATAQGTNEAPVIRFGVPRPPEPAPSSTSYSLAGGEPADPDGDEDGNALCRLTTLSVSGPCSARIASCGGVGDVFDVDVRTGTSSGTCVLDATTRDSWGRAGSARLSFAVRAP